jgi:RecA/RadA recombinase
MAEARKDKDNPEEKIDEINSKLANQMRLLAEIARKENIPVIATNQVYYDFLKEEDFKEGKERNANMVGGDIMRYWSKCIMELKNLRGRRTVVLKKHRSLGEKTLEFEICNEGIRKRGWL